MFRPATNPQHDARHQPPNRCLVQKRFLVTGGASPEVEVSYQLSKWSKTLQVRWFAGEYRICVSLYEWGCMWQG